MIYTESGILLGSDSLTDLEIKQVQKSVRFTDEFYAETVDLILKGLSLEQRQKTINEMLAITKNLN